MSLLVDIADALVAELNAQAWGEPFTAVRSYHPQYSLSADEGGSTLDTLRVTVVPGGIEGQKLTREHYQKTLKTDIAIQKVARTDAARDGLMDLAENILDHLLGIVTATGNTVCKITDVQNTPAWAPEHMAQADVFTSLITVTCEVIR